MIQFTGSTETGRAIAIRAAERLIPVSLELGGKDPMIVLDDADLERAANGAAWGGFFNSGQTCVAVERIYVEAPVYEQFLSQLVDKVSALRVGMDEPGSFTTDFGSLANTGQLSIVEAQVRDAKDKGARVVAGGNRLGTGSLYEPTVIVDVDHTMACMTEETFGPIVAVMKVSDEEEAIRLANDSAYGLSASVWSKKAARAMAVAERLETGAVNINNSMADGLQVPAPMGGWRASGIGTRHGGKQGIRKYCRSRTVVRDRFYPRTEPMWYPYTPKSSRIQARVVRLLLARDWRRRLGRKPR
jgi:acyl-CoA reductase-like NAD-dependent aldehyde dehydrogenase